MPIQAETDAARQEQGQTEPAQALTILRTDTVFAKLPIHALTKSVPVQIEINQMGAQGIQELYWRVSPSSVYGSPQLLAYKLDTLVINRHLDALKRPLPPLIPLGSLRQICQELGLSTGKATADVKRAFHQNAGVYITAKLRYRDLAGNQRRLEAGFHRYGVVFTGESLPDGSTADAVYLTLNESYRQVLNAAPTRPLDYDYLTDLKPLAQRFYELLSFKMYAALKHEQPRVSVRYSELCQFAPQQRYHEGARMSKQMYKVHQPHLQSGYLARACAESILDRDGRPDWLLHYVPGSRAHGEYRAFNGPNHPGRQRHPAVPAASQATAAMTDSPVLASSAPIPRGDINQQALTLAQCFYSQVHGSGSVTPHPRELDHAASLIGRHGWAFAVYFVTFACKAACQNCFSPHVFGGLLRYEASALAAYRHQQSQQARRRAERAETRQAYLRAQYEKQRSARIVAYRDTLTPEDLEALKHEVQTRLEAESAGIPRAAFEAWVNVELQEQLATLAEVPPFDVWLVQREATGLAADNPGPGCTPARGTRRYAKPIHHNPPGAPPQTDVTAPGATLHPANAKGATS